MADLKKLAEQRAALLTQASALVTETAERGESLTGEAQERFEKLTADAAHLADAIRSEKDAAEARAAADAVRGEYAAAVAPKGEDKRDISAELRKIAREGGSVELRDITRATFTQGVTQGDQFWITAGQYNPFLNDAITRVVAVSTGNTLALPRTTALGTAAAVNEGAAIGESDGTNSSLSLSPVKYATLVQIGLETVNDEAFDVSAWVQEKLAAEIAVAHGAVAAPAVAAAATVGKQGAAVAPVYADLADLIMSVNAKYRRAPKAGFLMNDATLGGIIKLLDSQNRPIFVPGNLNQPDTILGFPVHSADLANTGDEALSICFGDLNAVVTAVVTPGVTIESSRDYAFATGLVSYRGYVRGATGLIDGAAVKSFKGANV